MSKLNKENNNMGRQSNTTEYHLILSGKKRQTSVNLLEHPDTDAQHISPEINFFKN